jgi:hypothetical protein
VGENQNMRKIGDNVDPIKVCCVTLEGGSMQAYLELNLQS